MEKKVYDNFTEFGLMQNYKIQKKYFIYDENKVRFFITIYL
jgi:hypothetical protein